jgi:hypothetical protein
VGRFAMANDLLRGKYTDGSMSMLENQEDAVAMATEPKAVPAEGHHFELQLLQQAIDRTVAIVCDETASLRRGGIIDLQEFSMRKSHQLLALNRAFDAVLGAGQRERVTLELDNLRKVLEENASLLQIRLGAVQEIADIIASIMRDAESDGTYSRPAPGGER